jgi:serine/threonine protein kinase/mRNA-degrading endonuclease RelE of RelBE toxin-antitoxin system
VNFLISDTFTGSLSRLTGDEQKAAKITVFDLQSNPENPGMRFHKLSRARDRKFWSVRVNRDLRLIVHRAVGRFLVCFVGRHDDAYSWAERRKLERHPDTGATQFIEVRETVTEIVIPHNVEGDTLAPKPEPRPAPFAEFADEELLHYGVPEELFEDVRAADEDRLLEIFERIPEKEAETLLQLATGNQQRVPASVGIEETVVLDSVEVEKFRRIENPEQLELVLQFQWDKWDDIRIMNSTKYWDEGLLWKDGSPKYRFKMHRLSIFNPEQRAEADKCLGRLGMFRETLRHPSIRVVDEEIFDLEREIVWHLNKCEDAISLEEWLKDERPDTGARLKVIRSLLDGLVALHAEEIVHRNIHPGAVWVGQERTLPYLTDFELAFSPGPQEGTILGGQLDAHFQREWWAPEVYDEAKLLRNPEADCYSFGLLSSLLLSEKEIPSAEDRIREEWIPEIPQDIEEEFPGVQLWLSALCRQNPGERLSAIAASDRLAQILDRPRPSRSLDDLAKDVLLDNRYRVTGIQSLGSSDHFVIVFAQDIELEKRVVLKFAKNKGEALSELEKESHRISSLRRTAGSGDLKGLLLPRLEENISSSQELGSDFFVRKFWGSDLEECGLVCRNFGDWLACTKVLLNGLMHLGELDWAIRDISRNNVLISDRKPVLIDIGSALPLDEVQDQGGEFEGNPEYLPHYLLDVGKPNPELVEKRNNLLPRDLFASLVTSYFWLTGQHPWGSRRATKGKDPRPVTRGDLPDGLEDPLNHFFKRWLGIPSEENWHGHRVQVQDVLLSLSELEEEEAPATLPVINEDGDILGLKTEESSLAEPREGELTSVEAIDSEGRPHSIYFCKVSDEESNAELDGILKGLRRLKWSSIETWEFNEQILSGVRYLRIMREEEFSSPQDEGDLEVVCRRLLTQLERLEDLDIPVEDLGFSLHGPRPIWLPAILASAEVPRGIDAVIAVLERQFPDVEVVPHDGQEFAIWLQEQSVSASREVPTSWEDDYDRLQWEEVGEFFLKHLRDGSGPFKEIGRAHERDLLGEGRSGFVFEVIPEHEEDPVVKIVRSKSVTKTDWLQEGKRIAKARNISSENLARPQLPDLRYPGFFVFDAVNGSTLKKRWKDGKFHDPGGLARMAFSFSSEVHKLSDRWGVHCTDLHPGNIMVDTGTDQWVLIDYGEGFGRGFIPPEVGASVGMDKPRCMVYSLALVLLEELLRPLEEDRLLRQLRNAGEDLDYTTGDNLFGSDSGIEESDLEACWEGVRLAIQRRMEHAGDFGQKRCEEISSEVRKVFEVALDPEARKRYKNIELFTGALHDLFF